MKHSLLLVICAGLLFFGCGTDNAGNAGNGGNTEPDTGTIADQDTEKPDSAGSDDALADTGTGGTTDDAASTADANTGTSDTAADPEDTANSPDAGGDKDAGSTDPYKWFQTCGDPVCSGWKEKKEIPLCKDEAVGGGCGGKGDKCDPKNGCNAVLVCTDKDPKAGPGGCPISKRAVKKDIRYLDAIAEQSYAAQLYDLKLATWKYKQGDGATKLGIIIDDLPRSVAIDGRGDRVDLYSYTSLAIAAVKQQRRLIARQQVEMAQLRAEIESLKAMMRKE